MAFKLRIKFHGIIAAVPSTDGDQFTLFFTKAERTVVKDQVAYVRFPLVNYRSENSRRPISKDLLGYVALNQERLTIAAEIASADLDLRVNDRVDSTSSTPTSYDNNSLRWLPHIETLAPGSGDIAASYFTGTKGAHPLLLARVDLMQGRLSTTGADELQVPFRPISSGLQSGSPVTPSGPVQKRPIARELLLDLDIAGDSFVLQSEGFDGSRDQKNNLRFESSKDMEIVIGNESPLDIFTVSRPLEPIDIIASKCMREFIHYYRMCEVTPAAPLVPFLSARPGVETCCSVCIYNPSPGVKKKTATGVETLAAAPAWSAFGYIASDNSLSDVAQADLDEMEKADPGTISVVVQVDRGQKAERLVLSPGGFIPVSGDAAGDINFGKAASLTEFIQLGKRERPAKNMAVLFPTHGTGLLNYVYERLVKENVTDTFEGKNALRAAGNVNFERSFGTHKLAPDASSLDFLNNRELETGIRGSLGDDGPFAILGFDACMMGLVEMAYQLRHCGQYYVASQDDVRVEGWPYDVVLKEIAAAKTPLAAAQAIVDAYATATAADDLATLSAVDLNEIAPLAQALDALGSLLTPILANQIDALAGARQDARAFATFHYIDLYGFVDAIRTRLSVSMKGQRDLANIVAAAKAVLKAVDKAVKKLSKPVSSGALGLSVYVPNSTVAAEYHDLFFAKAAPAWHDFVEAYGAFRKASDH